MRNKIIGGFLIILLCALVLDGVLQLQLARVHRDDQILAVSLELSALRARIEKEVTSSLVLVESAANFISVTSNLTSDLFDRFAREALSSPNLLKNLTAAPDYVVQFVYPLKGNEALQGIDYRDVPGQWEQVQRAEKTQKLVVAGPLALIQGGTGLIGRAPVFTGSESDRRFWGIVSSVIDTDRLFGNVEIGSANLDIAIRRADGKGADGAVFMGDSRLFAPKAEAVEMTVAFPAGRWLMAATPKGGWSTNPPLSMLVHGLIALLVLVTAVASARVLKRNHEMQTTREILNQAQAIAHLGSWELDHASGAIWWSEETYRIFGETPGAFTPTLQNILQRVHPADREFVQDAFQSVVTACEKYNVDHRIIRPDGEVRHVQARGQTFCGGGNTSLRSTGTVLDITDRKVAEETLKASEERMRAMSESSHDAMIVIDANDTISFWNPAAETMFGWTIDEVLGKSMHLLITPPEYHGEAFKGLKRFAGTGQGPVIGTLREFTAIRKNGDRFPVERSVSAFKLGSSYYAVGTLRDISERKRIEHELQDYADRLSLASRAGGIGVWEWNVLTGKLVWDDQMFRLYSVGPNEFSGLFDAWRSRVHPEDAVEAENAIRQAVLSSGHWDWEFRVLWPDGQTRHIKAAAMTQANEQGNPEHMIGVNWDVTDARLAEERLRLMATTDSLTGLFNRRRFLELCNHELDRSRRYSSAFSIIMFDADRFKAVNDTYGHDVGDLVLQAIASTAKKTFRDVDIIGRIGGEEFVAAMPETDIHAAMLAAERLRAAVEQTTVKLTNGRIVNFTVSLGVAELNESCPSIEEMLKHADLALYIAKENGRNRAERYEPEIARPYF